MALKGCNISEMLIVNCSNAFVSRYRSRKGTLMMIIVIINLNVDIDSQEIMILILIYNLNTFLGKIIPHCPNFF